MSMGLVLDLYTFRRTRKPLMGDSNHQEVSILVSETTRLDSSCTISGRSIEKKTLCFVDRYTLFAHSVMPIL